MSGWAQREAERKEDEANEMDELITEVRELHTRLSAIIAERDALRAELARLQAKLSAAEDAEDAKNGAINNLTAELAAAKWLKESATDSYITDQQTGYLLLAAQALEAWAWQQEKGADVQYDIEDDSFVCDTFNGQYRRCTPLGAVMAAMEGERE